jgi:N6-L-threonylcarbamoyladenine synthase
MITVDHTEAHLLSSLLVSPAPTFPYVTLTASGGHSHLSLARGVGDYILLGSHDKAPRNRFGHGRAPGSVLDRCSDLLGLVPPGQPDGAIAIDRLSRRGGNGLRYSFPITELINKSNGYDFDFHALYEEVDFIKRAFRNTSSNIMDLALSVQECVMRVLVEKALSAARSLGVKEIAFGGGVAANSRLHELATECAEKEGRTVYFPPKELCGDNARMIAFAGHARHAVLDLALSGSA